MNLHESRCLHASDAARHARADRLAQVFDLYIRGASPAIASALAAASSSPIELISGAIIALADRTDVADAVQAFDRLSLGNRATRSDVVIGHALIAALADVLGPAFDEATREAWANGYIRLVETAMAARRNRMDFVA